MPTFKHPQADQVILAGVLLKLGAYGFMRLSIPFFEFASYYFQPLIFSLSCIAIVYTSIVALRQTDMKKMIAYSSVAHMGFVTIWHIYPNSRRHEWSILPND